ncbi:beta-lactamase/transpeptidase-like protein [Ramicandelaber brevisporus]|nr:beta-lactamase/transpeptidase-like protein [Ramicandelaber brevisporus]
MRLHVAAVCVSALVLVAAQFEPPLTAGDVEIVNLLPHKLRSLSNRRVAAAAAAAAATANEQQLIADFEHDFSALLKRRQVPGMIYTVVRQNKTIAASGVGIADANDPASKVDGDTLFMIGSVTKSMTAALFGTAVDEGKVKFTDKIHTVLPRFRLKDPFASQQCTFEDAMSHRTGLPRHDALFDLVQNSTLNEYIDRLQHLEPHTEFRSFWEYNNHMWAVTGHAAAAAIGKDVTYAEALKTRIFDKAGMKTALPNTKYLSQRKSKVSKGHLLKPGADGQTPELATVSGYPDIGNGAPAGNVFATANDAAAYLRMMLGKGLAQDGKTRVFSESTYNEIIRSRMPTGSSSAAFPPTHFPLEQDYAQGWQIATYRKKHRVIHHGGAIEGFISLFAFFPDDDLAIAASVNNLMDRSSYAAVWDLADRFLGYRDVDWGETMGKIADDAFKKSLQKPERVPGTKPSRSLEAFVGSYEHKGYGKLRIDVEKSEDGDSQLAMSLAGFKCTLEHGQYDTFGCDLGGGVVDFTFFSSSPSKKFDKINVGIEPALPELIFKRIE